MRPVLALLLTLLLAACASGVAVGPVADGQTIDPVEPDAVRLVIVAGSARGVGRWRNKQADPADTTPAPQALVVGTSGVTTRSAMAADSGRALFSFDLTAIPAGARIQEAVLVLPLAQPVAEWKQWTVVVSRAGPVPASLTWANQPAELEPAVEASLATPTRVEADVTAAVRIWRSGGPNNGFTVRGRPEGAPTHIAIQTGSGDRVTDLPRLVLVYVP